MAALLFSNKTVRDLSWVMSSPHLLTCHAGVRCLSDAWCAQLCRASLSWLRLLDDDPSHLHGFLRSHRNVRRLGFYFAALLEYWIRHCPFLEPEGGDGARMVLTQQQVHAGMEGLCAGQLKLVFERYLSASASASASSLATELVHLESHIKFFAWVPPSPTDHALVGDSDTTSHVHDSGLAAYVGPFLGENLFHRVVELRRKLSMSEAPAVRSFLNAHFRRPAPDSSPTPRATAPASTSNAVVSESIVRGYLFYPLDTGADHHGLLCGSSPSPPCAAVSGDHECGWWTTSLSTVLAHANPASLWAIPGYGADAVGSLGGKLHWLSPAVATSDVCSADPASMPVIRGIPSLGVDDCVLLTATQLRETLEQFYQAAHGWGPHEPSPNDDGSSPAAVLLFQMLPADDTVELPRDNAACSNAPRPWLEASRGFLMPPGWDPTPLCRSLPLGLKSNTRQKQRNCYKTGAVMREVDYRPADALFSVPHTLLAVRTGADGGFGVPSWMDGAEAAAAAHTGGFSVGSARGAAVVRADDHQGLAQAVVDEVCATWRKLNSVLHSQLYELSVVVIVACSLAHSDAKPIESVKDTDVTPAVGALQEALSRIGVALRALLASPQPDNSRHSNSASATVSIEGDGEAAGCSDKMSGGFSNSRFSLAKTTVSRAILRCAHVRGAVQLLRLSLWSSSDQRLLGSLFFAALASCKHVLCNDDVSHTSLVQVLTDIIEGTIDVPQSLVVEACQVLDARAAPTALCDGTALWPVCVPVSAVTRHVATAMSKLHAQDNGGITIVRHVSQLLRQLRVLHMHIVDTEDLLTRLVDSHQWANAEQLAAAACEEARALRTATGAESPFAAQNQAFQAAANDACASSSESVDPGNKLGRRVVSDGESTETVAAFLGGYNKRAGKVSKKTGQRLDSHGVRLRQGTCGEQVADVTTKEPTDDHAVQKVLLRLAQQRLNRKLVAKLSSLMHLDRSGDATAYQLTGLGCDGDRTFSSSESASGCSATVHRPPYSLPAATTVVCFDAAAEAAQAEAALQRVRERVVAPGTMPVVGLDAEWMAGRGVALLQLAVPGLCVLLRLHALPKLSDTAAASLLPPSLAPLLADPSLLKLGVGIAQDLSLIRSQFGIISSGVLDLQNLAACCGCAHAGLQRLTADALGLHLDKRVELRCSNWEAGALSHAQIEYPPPPAPPQHIVSNTTLAQVRGDGCARRARYIFALLRRMWWASRRRGHDSRRHA